MASVFVLLEAFNRKEAAALGFFPCATASCYSLGKYFAPAPRPLKTKRSNFTSFCNNRNDCGGVIWSNSATSERDSSAYYLVKRKGLLASSCFQHSFFYTCYIFDFLYFMTRILSHL